ncbi:MAG: heavy-metal-associated domain-containing protein [Firmicutes bacterium]|nr:heavy-metal-associated domain-containing protein [Bacillota bacterium]
MRVYLHIDGIHCGGCINAIDQLLTNLGADKVDIDLRTMTAKIDYFNQSEVDEFKIVRAIEEIGYLPIYLGKELEEILD